MREGIKSVNVAFNIIDILRIQTFLGDKNVHGQTAVNFKLCVHDAVKFNWRFVSY